MASKDAAAVAEQTEDRGSQDEGYLLVELGPKGLNVPGRPGATRIFHEFDDEHPHKTEQGGEALVTAKQVVRVAPTLNVRRAIAEGMLRDVTGRKQATAIPPNVSDILSAHAVAQGNEVARQNARILAEAQQELTAGSHAGKEGSKEAGK